MCVEPDGAECWCAGASLSYMIYHVSCNIYCITYVSYIIHQIYLMCVEPDGAECWLVIYDLSHIYCVSYIIYATYDTVYLTYLMCVEPDGAECWCAGAGLSSGCDASRDEQAPRGRGTLKSEVPRTVCLCRKL